MKKLIHQDASRRITPGQIKKQQFLQMYLPKEDEINNFVSVGPIRNYYTDRIKFKNVNGMSMKIHVASQRDLG